MANWKRFFFKIQIRIFDFFVIYFAELILLLFSFFAFFISFVYTFFIILLANIRLTRQDNDKPVKNATTMLNFCHRPQWLQRGGGDFLTPTHKNFYFFVYTL